jgi:hypothetical protein
MPFLRDRRPPRGGYRPGVPRRIRRSFEPAQGRHSAVDRRGASRPTARAARSRVRPGDPGSPGAGRSGRGAVRPRETRRDISTYLAGLGSFTVAPVTSHGGGGRHDADPVPMRLRAPDRHPRGPRREGTRTARRAGCRSWCRRTRCPSRRRRARPAPLGASGLLNDRAASRRKTAPRGRSTLGSRFGRSRRTALPRARPARPIRRGQGGRGGPSRCDRWVGRG